jgi:3-keto-5-aminohexanoate cleavage enzyme
MGRMSSSRLVMAAVNGARRQKTDHPALPVSEGEIARACAECHALGAGAVHVHARDKNGQHSLDTELYKTLLDAIRREAGHDLIIQFTTESAGLYDVNAQRAVLDAFVGQTAISVALREFFPKEDQEVWSDSSVSWWKALQKNTALQIILYDLHDLTRLDDLIKRGVIPQAPYGLLFVLGSYARQDDWPANRALDVFSALHQYDTLRAMPWMVCAFGQSETRFLTEALLLGGHVRIGFENNVVKANGVQAISNGERVQNIIHLMRQLDFDSLSGPAGLAILGQNPSKV